MFGPGSRSILPGVFRGQLSLAGWGFVGACLFTGCMVGPDYEPPSADAPSTPEGWHTSMADGLDDQPLEVSAWWRSFNDPQLDTLIALAEVRNLRLQTAAARIDVARAKYGIAAADLFPMVDGVGHAHWTRRSRDSTLSEIVPNSDYVAALDMNWEIDLWGRVRRSMESAEAQAEASVEDWRGLLVTIRAEVAASYIAARTLQQELQRLNDGIALRREALDLTQQKYDAGTVTDLDLARAIASLNAVESRIPGVETDLAQSINRISVLIGEAPGPLRERLDASAPIPTPPVRIAVGIPADVIRQRPDIRAAERQIAARSARIGEATALLLPQLKINGAIGYEAFSFDNWFDGDNWTGGIGPAVVWPIFAGGKILGNIEAADLETRAAVLEYEQTVLGAFEEVENVLVGYVNAVATREHLRETVEAYERVVGLATERYEAGVEDLEDLLESQRLLLEAQEEHVKAEGQVAVLVVDLYRALGGEWHLSPGPTPPQESEESRFPLPLKPS